MGGARKAAQSAAGSIFQKRNAIHKDGISCGAQTRWIAFPIRKNKITPQRSGGRTTGSLRDSYINKKRHPKDGVFLCHVNTMDRPPNLEHNPAIQRSDCGVERRKTFAVEAGALARLPDIQRSFLSGAGYGNRTRLLGLGSRCTTDVLILRQLYYCNITS